MDINQINNNSISNLNSSSQLQLNKSSATQKVNDTKLDELNINIGNLSKQRSEFSANVQSLNDGIAISKIATTAINKQQDYLQNIQTKLENINNLNNKNDIKQSINEDLRNFNKISYETNYKKESILVQNYYDQSQNIEVNTSNQTFSMEKPNVSNFANQIFETINNTDLNNLTIILNQSIDANTTLITNHKNDTTNPHQVTKAQVGLGNVDNTSDANKPVSIAQLEALELKADKIEIYTRTVTD